MRSCLPSPLAPAVPEIGDLGYSVIFFLSVLRWCIFTYRMDFFSGGILSGEIKPPCGTRRSCFKQPAFAPRQKFSGSLKMSWRSAPAIRSNTWFMVSWMRVFGR